MKIDGSRDEPYGAGSIRIERAAGGGFRLEAEQFLPQPREDVFNFFSDAFQLQTLTPAWLHFAVLNSALVHISTGTTIDYRLRIHGLPLRWRSLISIWEPPVRFVDEQLRGPYRRWRHEHTFEAVDGGTFCHDTVAYDVLGGSLANAMFVRPDLLKIFAFRQQKLREIFAINSNVSIERAANGNLPQLPLNRTLHDRKDAANHGS